MGGSDASSSPELHPSSAELEFLDAVTFPSMDVIGDYTMDVEPSGIDSEANGELQSFLHLLQSLYVTSSRIRLEQFGVK